MYFSPVLRRQSCLHFLLSGYAAVAFFIITPAFAEEVNTFSFDIQSQPLNLALSEYARQSQQQILFSPDIVAGQISNVVRGKLKPLAALDILLEGSNLEYSQTTSDAILIRLSEKSTTKDDKTVKKKALGSQDDAAAGAKNEQSSDTNSKKRPMIEQQDSDSSWQIDEIIVTANRREQSLIEVSSSISVFEQGFIEQRGIDSIKDIIVLTPGIVADNPELFGDGNDFTIRGVSGQPLSTATVGVYLDEVPLTVGEGANEPTIRTFDLERVELLRGPQGTLYGAGAMGGAIRYISNKPDASEFDGQLRLEGSSIKNGGEDYAIDGAVNVPLAPDRLALRVTGSYDKRGGYIDLPNALDGPEKDANTRELASIRGVLRFTPNDDLTVDLQAWYEDRDFDGLRVLNTGATSLLVDDAETGIVSFGGGKFEQYALTVSYDFGWMEAVSSTSFIKNDSTVSFPQILFPPAPFTTNIENELESFTQELRLVSRHGGPFSWIFGIFYQDSDSQGFLEIPDFFGLRGDGIEEREQLSFYGELSYQITKTLQATVGLRHFTEDSFESFERTLFGFPALVENDNDFDKTVPKFALTFLPSENINLYGSVSQGFRVGGLNLSPHPADPTAFNPDSLWAYEVGLKAKTLDGRLNASVAAFYNDWSSIQIFQFGLGGGVVVNGGEAHTQGIEAQVSYQLIQGLVLSANASLMEAEFDETVAVAGITDGNRIPDVAESNAAILLDYTRPIWDDKQFEFHLDTVYAGNQVNPDQSGKRGSSVTWNARAGVSADQWKAAIYVRNLGNRLVVDEFNDFFFAVERPRTIGIEVSRHF